MAKLYSSVVNPEDTLVVAVQTAIAQVVVNSSAEDITPMGIEDVVMRNLTVEEWGLTNVKVSLITFAYVKTIRLIGDKFTGSTDYNYSMTSNSTRDAVLS